MASNNFASFNGDDTTQVNANHILTLLPGDSEATKPSLLTQPTTYYSIDNELDEAPPRHEASLPTDIDSDSSSDQEFFNACEMPLPLNSPEHVPMPALDDYLEGRDVLEKMGEKHSTLPTDQNSIQRIRSELKHSYSTPNIGENVFIKNLDNGEIIALEEAAVRIPQGVSLDPLSSTLKQRTPGLMQEVGTDQIEESLVGLETRSSDYAMDKKKYKRKSFKGVVKSAKHLFKKKQSGSGHDKSLHSGIKFKSSPRLKSPPRYQHLELIQELSNVHDGPIWTMKFSSCGKLLATGGQDKILRIWCVNSAREEFLVLREKYRKNQGSRDMDTTPDEISPSTSAESPRHSIDRDCPFGQVPFAEYRGHLSDILDMSWSNNYFMLTSSMDKTVRLWHVALGNCLSVFEHKDFVTAIAFYPNDERYFISGSLDGKLRLWHVIEKNISRYNEVPNTTGNASKLITAANFCYNGKLVVIGTYDGKCFFYDSDHLKYHTQIRVRSTHGANSTGHKITGIVPHPTLVDRILVTSNDSRIRLYNLKDYKLECKYKGSYVNTDSQSKATFSAKGDHIICGSQDHAAYMWRTESDLNLKHARRDKNPCYESISSHNSVVTVAIFAPNLEPFAAFSPSVLRNEVDSPHDVILTADYFGQIKIFSL